MLNGVLYDPTPFDNDRNFDWPTNGDFFTSAHFEPELPLIWQRDFLVLRESGASTVRLRPWDNHADHHYFFLQALNKGMYVMPTHSFGSGFDQHEEWQRQSSLGAFEWQSKWYSQWTRRDSLSLVGWQLGEEINAAWNGWLKFDFAAIFFWSEISRCFSELLTTGHTVAGTVLFGLGIRTDVYDAI